MFLRTALALLILAAAALIGWRVLAPAGNPSPSGDVAAAPAGSDYYMRNATIYQMNKQGELAYRLKLGEMLHYPDDSARLRDIDVHYEAGTRTFWTLEAARGRVPPGSRDLHLTGGVTLRHPETEVTTVVVHTDNAWIRTRRNVIETRAHVTARTPARVVQAGGLHIDLDTDRMKLRDDVQVRYTP